MMTNRTRLPHFTIGESRFRLYEQHIIAKSRQRTNAICPMMDYSATEASTITNGCASLVAASVLRT